MSESIDSKAHEDAMNAATDYLRRAQREIDETFKKGYAEANPSLVAAFMKVCAMEFASLTESQAQTKRP